MRFGSIVSMTVLAAALLPTSAATAGDATCQGRQATHVGTIADDRIVGTPKNDVIVGLQGRDVINGKGGNDTICGSSGDDIILGRGGRDHIDGGDGDDVMAGGRGHDTLEGGAGDNVFAGGRGGDRLIGSGVVDAFVPGPGHDDIHGGPTRVDVVSFAGAHGVRVDLRRGSVRGEGRDRIDGVDDVIGSPRRDVIKGDGSSDRFWGGGGNDKLAGRGDGDFLIGGGGNDVISGGGGDHDYVSFEDSRSPVRVDLKAGIATGQGRDTLRSVDMVMGSKHDDHISGDGGWNTLNGKRGIDVLRGRGNQDKLYVPQSGLVKGGAGRDSVHFMWAGGAATVDLSKNRFKRRGEDSWSRMTGIEVVYGSSQGDTFIGTAGRDRIYGEGGKDLYYASEGDDFLQGGSYFNTISYEHFDAPVTVNGSRADSSLGSSKIIGFSKIIATRFDDEIEGYMFVEIEGRAGNDRLTSHETDDLISGGQGDDEISSGEGGDHVDGGPGADSIDLGPGSREESVDWRVADTADGGDGNDSIYGGDEVEGAHPHDLLVGGAGDDSFTGGLGDDTVSYVGAPSSVTVDLDEGTATGWGTDSFTGIVSVRGSTFADILLGSSLADFLWGDEGDDDIQGREGDDRLTGESGTDRIDGGPGADRCSAEEQQNCEEG